MAANLSSLFLGHEWIGSNSKQSRNLRLIFPSTPRFLPASCKMRRRNPRGAKRGRNTGKNVLTVGCSSDHKRRFPKKDSSEPTHIDKNLPPSGNEEKTTEKQTNRIIPSLNQDVVASHEVHGSVSIDHHNENESSMSRVDQPSSDLGVADGSTTSLSSDRNDISSYSEEFPSADEPNSSLVALTTKPLTMSGGENLSSNQLEDLISMIKNAERNVLLLNQARIRALQDMEKILGEKEALQGEINTLEMKLAETDAKIKVAAQQKIHAELLGEQLEKMKKELLCRGEDMETKQYITLLNNKASFDEIGQSTYKKFNDLNEELSTLKVENASLKDQINVLGAELSDMKMTTDRVTMLEEEKSHLEYAVKDLESKLNNSDRDSMKLASLKVEYQNLSDKVQHLQVLLDEATKQAGQSKLVLQQNQVLLNKVDSLEKSLEKANAYRRSSQQLQQQNELLHQKVKLLEERLEKSADEMQSYVQQYQESIQDFHDTLESIKDEGKKRAMDEPVDHMPWQFWSHLLLLIDGWLLEKKLSVDNAKMLREMVWKRNRRICDAFVACKDKNEREIYATLSRLTSVPTSSALHIIHIAAELAPVAKVGGLGDVVTGLGKALQKKGHLVEIVLPKYDCMHYDLIRDLRVLDTAVESYFDGQIFKNKIWVGTVEGLPVYFIEPLHPSKFFWRGQHYGEHDDFKRFSFFSRAALELLHQAGKKPDIIHCHDWQTSFVAPLYWDIYAPKGLNSARICFTCHNFEYQGTAPASELRSCGLDVDHQNRPDRMQDHSAQDRVNPVKGAVVFSNIVTTVSPSYALEVSTPEGGRGLHSTLNTHSKKFVGILNGIDTDSWNPATDTFLHVQYSSADLAGKVENKEALRRQLGLSSTDVRQPLVGCITRLVPQKGIHLIKHAIYRTLELGGQFVLLGSSPVSHIQREFEGIAQQFQNHDHVRLILKYDDSLSHSIYSAADLFIIPSIFEPCGLTQMIAMRYGAIPVARKTGGLNDSVFDLDDDTIPLQFRNGFTFVSPDEQGLNSALDRAILHYKNDGKSWDQLVTKVMNLEFSWEVSGSQYEELYRKSVARARAARHS